MVHILKIPWLWHVHNKFIRKPFFCISRKRTHWWKHSLSLLMRTMILPVNEETIAASWFGHCSFLIEDWGACPHPVMKTPDVETVFPWSSLDPTLVNGSRGNCWTGGILLIVLVRLYTALVWHYTALVRLYTALAWHYTALVRLYSALVRLWTVLVTSDTVNWISETVHLNRQ